MVPLSQLKSTFPALRTVGRRKAAGFTFEQWHYAFCNTFPEALPAAVRALPHPGLGAGPGARALATLEPATRTPTSTTTTTSGAAAVHLRHPRPPHAASVQRSNAKHYKSKTVTEVVEFDGPHLLLPSKDGWEEVADYALEWAVSHARQANPGKPQTPAHNDNPHHPHRRPDGPYRGGGR